ncbi:voltage-gated potassium channel [Desulfurobacterium pacificum]|jgi:voltage-gated potassium channel|uniref:Voltage-gated potassium channel n=1 Tax=Desulfurobacterium pacificum TaxID=240166 RepID=A0ABY1NFW0_9BACT|nr:potassium channel protein [Desulfurobacterium pacificum]SMP08467.1 voltage-gated potassium channel [Desulfurobacterium pacificum]
MIGFAKTTKKNNNSSELIFKKFLIILSLLILIVLLSTFGIMFIEHWSFLDALWHTIITISTVGYGEVRPLSPAGKVFTMIVIVVSFTFFAYGAFTVASMIMEGELRKFFIIRKMEKLAMKLKNHTIVCGLGRTGQAAIKELWKEKVPFVVIEKDEAKIEEAKEKYPNLIYILGDATEDETLIKAGVKSAANMIVATADDADNLFITLSAKNLNPNLRIVTRANREENVVKLKRAGATEVILPNVIGGLRMASLAIRPSVVSFLDIVTHHGEIDLRLEEVKVPKGSPFHGKLLKDLEIPKKTGVVVIGVRREDGSFILNPTSTTMILEGDSLIIIGTREQADKLKRLVRGEEIED